MKLLCVANTTLRKRCQINIHSSQRFVTDSQLLMLKYKKVIAPPLDARCSSFSALVKMSGSQGLTLSLLILPMPALLSPSLSGAKTNCFLYLLQSYLIISFIGVSRWLRWLRWYFLLAMQDMRIRSLGCEDLLEDGMAMHSSILAWRIPWTEEPGGLQSMGSQRVPHD